MRFPGRTVVRFILIVSVIGLLRLCVSAAKMDIFDNCLAVILCAGIAYIQELVQENKP